MQLKSRSDYVIVQELLNTMNSKWIFFDIGWMLLDETYAHRARLAETRAVLAGLGPQYSVEQLMALCGQAATDFAPSPFHGTLKGIRY